MRKGIRIAAMLAAPVMALPASAQIAGGADSGEIIVTATKREQSVLDVPISIAVLGEAAVSSGGGTNLREFVTSVPGITLFDFGAGQSTLVLRGLTTAPDGETNGGTVAFYVDEVAVGTGRGVFNAKPVDIERIEILRGPQGTLYGAGSIGGTYRLITRRPNPSSVAAGGRVTLFGQDRGDRMGYDLSAYVNLPLGDATAVRLVGYVDRDPNFVRNRTLDTEVGGATGRGLRASFLTRPSEDVTILLQYLFQDQDASGSPQSHVDLPRFEQARQFEGVFQRYHLGIGTITWDFGAATLTSVTSYLDSKSDYFEEATALIGVPSVLKIGRTGDVFSQELRVQSNPDSPFDWIVGGFFERTRSGRTIPIFDTDVATELLLFVTDETDIKQYAVFGEVGVPIGERLTFTAGARHARYTGDTVFSDGIVVPDGPEIVDRADSTFNPKFNLAFRPRDDSLLYFQAVKGFRAGGARQPLSPACDLFGQAPSAFGSDKVWTYEAGGKAAVADGRVTVEAAAYYNDWKNIPVFIGDPSCGQAYVANAGRAETYGVEASVTARPIDGLTIGLNGAWGQTELLDPGAIGGAGVAGESLPGNPRWLFTFKADYETPVLDDVVGFVGFDLTYVGAYKSSLSGDLAASAVAFPPPYNVTLATDPGAGDYIRVNARLGARFDERFEVSVFATNITNSDAVTLFNYLSGSGIPSFTYLAPRKVGVTFLADF